MLMNLASCPKCVGDLVQEEDEWRCLQCGHLYYPQPVSLPAADSNDGQKWSRRPSGGIPGRNINSLIEAQNRKQERHPQVVTYLNEGRSVHEIAAFTGLSQRTVRSVRERYSEPYLG